MMNSNYHKLDKWWIQITTNWTNDEFKLPQTGQMMNSNYHKLDKWWIQITTNWTNDEFRLPQPGQMLNSNYHKLDKWWIQITTNWTNDEFKLPQTGQMMNSNYHKGEKHTQKTHTIMCVNHSTIYKPQWLKINSGAVGDLPSFHWQAANRVCLFVGFLTSLKHASVSQGRICSDNFTCCHTEIEVADQTF